MRTYEPITLLDSAARTVSGTLVLPRYALAMFDRCTLLLDVTTAAADAADTLDVFAQKNVGTPTAPVWQDFAHFAQVLGNGGAKQLVCEVSATAPPTSAAHAVQDGALAASSVLHGPWSADWRIKWVIVDGSTGGNVSFTFALHGQFSGS